MVGRFGARRRDAADGRRIRGAAGREKFWRWRPALSFGREGKRRADLARAESNSRRAVVVVVYGTMSASAAEQER